MALSDTQKKFLRGKGHGIKPVITVGGNGLTAGLQQEFESSLAHHELLKVRVRVGDRALRGELIDELCKAGDAELVSRVGNVALLFRPNPESPRIKLPA